MHDHPGDCPYDIEDDVICLGEFGDATTIPDETSTKDGKKSRVAASIAWALAILTMIWFIADMSIAFWYS